MHKRYTGVSNKPILANLELLKTSGKTFVVRAPLIPTVNDSQENLLSLAEKLLDADNLQGVELRSIILRAGKIQFVEFNAANDIQEKTFGDEVLEPFRKHGLLSVFFEWIVFAIICIPDSSFVKMNSPKKRRLHTNFSKDETVSSIAANDAVKRWRKLELAFGAMVSCFIVLSVFCAPEGNIREGDYLPVVLVFLLFVTGFALWTYRLRIQSAKIDESSLLETEALSDKPFRFVWLADAFLGVFLLGATLSYLRVVFGHTGEVRLSTNAYWTFITPVLFYFYCAYIGIFVQSLISVVCADFCMRYFRKRLFGLFVL